jgi:hypothetical protein
VMQATHNQKRYPIEVTPRPVDQNLPAVPSPRTILCKGKMVMVEAAPINMMIKKAK